MSHIWHNRQICRDPNVVEPLQSSKFTKGRSRNTSSKGYCVPYVEHVNSGSLGPWTMQIRNLPEALRV